MAAVDEIAIKLGVKTGDLKAALSDAGATIKKFKKEGDGEDGLVKTLKAQSKGFNDLKSLVLGGGILGSVVGFFDKAFDAAKKTEGAIDDNTAATLRMAGTFDSVKESFAGATVTLTGWVTRFGEGIGKVAGALVYGKEAVKQSEALAAAEAQAVLQKEKKKEIDDKLKTIAEALTNEAKRHNELVTKGLTDEEKLAKLKKAELDATALLANAGDDQVKRQSAFLELKKAQNALLEVQNEVQKKADAEEKQAAEALRKTFLEQRDAKRELMTLDERRKSLLSEEAALKAVIEVEDRNTKEYAEDEARLLVIQNKLRDQGKDQAVANKEIAILMLKGAENLTEIEKERLRLLKGETTEVAEQNELSALLQAGVENLTDAERARLLVLTGQTAEITKQAQIESAAAKEKLEQAKALDRFYSGSIKQKGDVQSLDSVQLNQLIGNLTKSLGNVKESDSSYFGVGTTIGSYKSIEQLLMQQNLDAAIKEKNLRSSFARTAQTLGADAAKRTYAPGEYERLAQLMNPEIAKKQAGDIAAIAGTLRNVFPEQFSGIR